MYLSPLSRQFLPRHSEEFEDCTNWVHRLSQKFFHAVWTPYRNRALFFTLWFILQSTTAWSASHHPQDFLNKIVGAPNEGLQIVQHYCANCHAEKPMIQLGAPRMGVLSEWIPRIKKGMPALFKNTDEGFNAMPARGGCFECTDKQLLLAIMAMLPETVRKSLY